MTDTFLIVEDDPKVSEVLTGWLENLYPTSTVHHVQHGKDALALYEQKKIDLVLLDYQLPDFNGIEFLQKIRKNNPSNYTPIIMLTAASDESVAVNSFKHGVTDYLAKSNLTVGTLERAIIYAQKTVADHFAKQQIQEQLEKSQARYRALINNANDLIQNIHPDGRLLYANKSWTNLLGYDPVSFKDKCFFDLVHPNHREHFQSIVQHIAKTQEPQEHIEVDVITKNGLILSLEGHLQVEKEFHDTLAVAGIFRDITPRKLMEQELKDDKQLFEVTLRSIGEAVVCTDTECSISFMNPIAEQLTGWHMAEAQGKQIEEVMQIFFEGANIPIPSPVTACLSEEKVTVVPENALLVSREGSEYLIKNTVAPISTDSGTILGSVIVFKDVTEAEKLSREMRYQSSHDALTGLSNRFEFEHRLENALETAKSSEARHAMCFLDLDNFKIVNDTAGHIAGDALLKQVAHTMENSLRSGDTLARLGGDEFGILLENCPLEKAEKIASNIIKAIQNMRFHWNKKIYEVGVSIGIVPITKDSESSTQLFSHSDKACYTAKDSGSNQVVIYFGDDDRPEKRYQDVLRAASLKEALDDNKFCLYAQVIVEPDGSDNSQDVFYELLLRLQDRDNDNQLILPGSFIPAAEKYKLMPSIDRWVIQNALSNYHLAFGRTSNAIISINLSGTSLSDTSLLDFILNQFQVHQIPTHRVCFEITETAAISNLAQATKIIQVLKSQGCLVALDDFGSGLSSFKYLKQFPIDYLKIDGSFIQNIVHDSIDNSMVKSINQIGQEMKIKTIAEWVENEPTLKYLQQMGVNYVQGNHLGLPMPYLDAGKDYSRRMQWAAQN